MDKPVVALTHVIPPQASFIKLMINYIVQYDTIIICLNSEIFLSLNLQIFYLCLTIGLVGGIVLCWSINLHILILAANNNMINAVVFLNSFTTP